MLDSRLRSLAVALSCGVSRLLSSAVSAAGFLFYEVGTTEVASASVVYTTRVAGPSTLLTNPAGMTRLEGTQVQVGSALIYGHLQFTLDVQTDPSLGRNDGGNAVGLLPGGGVFATFSLTRALRAGIGVFTNFGAPQSWDRRGWAGTTLRRRRCSGSRSRPPSPGASTRASRWEQRST